MASSPVRCVPLASPSLPEEKAEPVVHERWKLVGQVVALSQSECKPDWDVLQAIRLGAEPTEFKYSDDKTREIAEHLAVLKAEITTEKASKEPSQALHHEALAQWENITNVLDSVVIERSRLDLDPSARGNSGFMWPSDMYLEYRVSKEVTHRLAYLTENTLPSDNLDAQLRELFPGYDKMMERLIKAEMEQDETEEELSMDGARDGVEMTEEHRKEMKQFWAVMGLVEKAHVEVQLSQ